MLRPIDLGNPVNRGASLNLGLLYWWKGMPNNKGTRTIFDLCGANHMLLTNGGGANDPTAFWSPKAKECEFTTPGGVSPAYYGVSASQSPDCTSTGFSCSAWLWPVDVSTYNVVLGIHTGIFQCYAGWSGTGLIYASANGGSVSQTSGPNLVQYQPCFATWSVFANGLALLYVNGFEVGNSGVGQKYPPNTGTVYLAQSYYGYGSVGGVGSVRLWNRGLTAGECLALYEEEVAGNPYTLNRYTPRTVVLLGGAVAAPVSATPGVASLTTTRYAPSVATPRTATPPVKSLSITRYAPAVATPRTATIGKLSLTATKYAPTVSTPRLSTPGVKSLALTPLAPVVSTPRAVTVGFASLSTAVYAPSVATPRTSTPSVASLSLAGFAPTVASPRTATPAPASLTAAGYAPTVLVPRATAPGEAALSLTSFAPVAATPRAVVPDAAAVAITSYAPVVVTPRTTTPATGSLSLTAYAPLASVPRTSSPGIASLVITAFAPEVAAGSSAAATPGTLALAITLYAPAVGVSGTYEGGFVSATLAVRPRIFATPSSLTRVSASLDSATRIHVATAAESRVAATPEAIPRMFAAASITER